MINYKLGLRKLKPVFIIILAFVLWIQAFSNNDPKVQIIGHPTIVIDPGHGGHDPGASGQRSVEKDINLRVALRLKALLAYHIPEVIVLLTRETDEFIPLSERTKIANDHKADLFISLHCNSNTSGSVQGSEVFIMGTHKSDDNLLITARENLNTELFESSHSDMNEMLNNPEDFIFVNQLQSQVQFKSLEFASLCVKSLESLHPAGCKEARQAGFVVLWQASMPSILLEMGYINNKKDEAFLLSDEGQIIISTALVHSIKNYFLQRTHEIANSSIPMLINEEKSKKLE